MTIETATSGVDSGALAMRSRRLTCGSWTVGKWVSRLNALPGSAGC